MGGGLGVKLGLGLGLGLKVGMNVGEIPSVPVAVELSPPPLAGVVERQTPAGSVEGQSTKAHVKPSTMSAKPLVKSPQPAVIWDTIRPGTSSSLSTMEPSSMALKSSTVSLMMAPAPSKMVRGIVRAMSRRPTIRSRISAGRFSIRVGTWPDSISVKKRLASSWSFSRRSMISQGIWSRRPMIPRERKRPKRSLLD